MPSICGITTRAATARVMVDGLAYLSNKGYDCTLICEFNSDLKRLLAETKIKYLPIGMAHGNVSIKEVLKCTYLLYRIFKKKKFDIIQYASCNASLYACIAGWLARIRVRVLCQWGLTYLGFSGFKRFFYKSIEKLTCWFSTNVQPDSPSNLVFAIQEGLYKKAKGNVIWNGSACGLNFERFDLSSKKTWRNQIRTEFKIEDKALVYGFVGRIVGDKGINELLSAFLRLYSECDNIYLILFGPLDGEDEISNNILIDAMNCKHILWVGPRKDINKCYAALDYVVMPSYREGLSMVLLESAAMGIPVISSNINGSTDFVIDGFNGLICEAKSSNSLYNSMLKAKKMELKEYVRLSKNTYSKAKEEYQIEIFREHFLKDRNNLLEKR